MSERQPIVLVFVAVVALAAALAVTAEEGTPSGGRDLCAKCHTDLDAVLGGTLVHAPVELDDCTSCHNPHAARHGNLLHDVGAELCESCHEGIGRTEERPVPHMALTSERACLSCHAPHGAEHAALMIDETLSLCRECHASVGEQVEAEHPHAPAALGECAACHEPHAGTSAGLLEQDAPAACWSCHDNSAELRSKHWDFDLTDADCLSCHRPHGSTEAALMRPAAHMTFVEDGACDTCHESAADPSKLIAPEPELCGVCHDGYHEEGSAAYHPVDDSVTCTDCHSPHAGESPGMIRRVERIVCLDCHTEIRDRFADSISRHPASVEGGRCSACHAPHEAGAEPLLARSRKELCVGCHQQHSRFAHPMGDNVPDPRTPGATVGCLSCHDPHASDHKMTLLGAPDRDLCVECHAGSHGIE